MVFRRELLPILLAVAFLLVGPAQAPASPEWLGAEPLDATLNATVPADVAADANGNAVAVWLAGGEVRSAYRPRGGPWGAPESLDPGVPVVATQPRVTVQPNGQFVAAWLGDRVDTEAGYPLRWARRPAGGGWSDPALITGIGCCPGITALEANADGSVLLVATDEGTGTSFRKPPGSETWGPGESLPSGQNHRVAVAPDGSAAAAIARGCPSNGELQCVVAAFRPPGGPWGEYEEVARVSDGSQATGWEIAATPSSGFTVMWGEATNSDSGPVAPGAVRSADRAPGLGGGWGSAETAVALADDIPFCNFANCFDLAVRADGVRFGAWHQTGAGGNQIGGVVGTPGAWGFPQLVGETGTSSATPFVVFASSTGLPVVVWGSNVRGQGVPHGAAEVAPGVWRPQELVDGARGGPPAENGVYLGDLAADGEGNAVTAWEDPSGVDATALDGIGPRFTAFGLPSGSAGQVLAFSAAADDNWSGPASIGWAFGDGGTATGGAVSHAYGTGGTFTATARATDGVGNFTEQSGPVNVAFTHADPCTAIGGDVDKDGIRDCVDDNNGAARPRPFKTVNATVVSGDVFVKLPAGAASTSQAKPPKGFVRLEGAETIPVGSTLDTKRGRVKVRSAADTKRKTQTGQFFRGRFVIRQARIKRRSKKLITDMRLTGSSFRQTCRANRASISAKRKRSKKRVRRLFGNAKGSFRTSGRNAAATVRGTRWSVQDRCDGTKVTVQRGRVEVRDKVKRKTIIVRTGHTYLARLR